MTNKPQPAPRKTPNGARSIGPLDNRKSRRSRNRSGRYTPPGLVQPTAPREPCRCPACAPPPCLCSACEDERLGIAFDPDREWQRMKDVIEQTGMFTECVIGGPDEVSWANTIGRLRRGRPELIAVGLDPQRAFRLLQEIEATWDELTIPDDGICCVPGKPQRRFALLPVPDSVWFESYLRGALHDAVEQDLVDELWALQVVWPDDDGRFPWEPGTSASFRRRQPILGLGD